VDYKTLITQIESITELHPKTIRKVMDAFAMAVADELRNRSPVTIADLGTLCMQEAIQHTKPNGRTVEFLLKPSREFKHRLVKPRGRIGLVRG